MDVLQVELAKLQRDHNLAPCIGDVGNIIQQLERAREAIVAGEERHILRAGFRTASNAACHCFADSGIHAAYTDNVQIQMEHLAHW
jgi:hypothetical protein